jgi:hypothetical protein
MTYLLPENYVGLVDSAIGLKDREIGNFFFSYFKKYGDDNLGFTENLIDRIMDLENQLETQKINYAAKKSEVEIRSKGAVHTDFLSTIDWSNHTFYYWNSRLFYGYEPFMLANKEKEDELRFFERDMIKLRNGYNDFIEILNNIDEPLPEYKFDTEAQKIAWLYEIGIIETVIQLCKVGEINNYSKTAKVIHSFTGIHLDTIRKCIDAIYKPNSDQKNNPLINPENKLFVRDMLGKFKISKKE